MCATPVADGGEPHNSLFQTRFGDEPCHAAQESHDFNRGRCQGFVEFNDNGADFAQFKDANMDTRYSVREKVSGDILGYLPLETGELVGIVREKEKPILLLIIAVIAALVLLVALITASLYKMVNKPLDGSGSDASSASSEIVIADGEAYDGTMDNGKTDSEEMRFIEFPA